jgi:hypothetical protein
MRKVRHPRARSNATARSRRINRTSVLYQGQVWGPGSHYGSDDTESESVAPDDDGAAEAAGDIAGSLASVFSAAWTAKIAAKSQEQLTRLQSKFGIRQTKAEASLVGKQSELALAQAQLVSAQQGYRVPLMVLGVSAMFLYGFSVYHRKD